MCASSIERWQSPPRARLEVILAAVAVALCSPTWAADAPDGPEAATTRPSPATLKRRPARLEVIDPLSFTITEQVRISGEARSAYDSALQLLERQQYEQGITLLLDVTEKAPTVTAPYINLGIAYVRIGDLERGEASLTTALELNPEHPVAHNELGLLYRETGRFAAARQSYEKALAIHPGFHFAHRNLAILCDVYLNDLPCALEHYEAYSRAVPDDQEALIWVTDIRSRVSP
jgi:tetratricopeptide (TPR) repeat protein